jgi:uncharacterized protein
MSPNINTTLLALWFLLPIFATPASAQNAPAKPAPKSSIVAPAAPVTNAGVAVHKLAIQVNDNDPKTMNLALNNVANLTAYYKTKGELILIEVVTYGPGLHMLRADTSPVKARISAMSLEMPHVTFSACQNTRENMSKAENKPVEIVIEAKTVPSGVVTLLELQERGFAYIRP